MHIKSSYLVCATPRSGSSLLCEMLAGTNLAGNPQEFFWEGFEPVWSRRWEVSEPQAYLRSAIRQGTSANGVFGAKIMWSHLDYFVQRFLGDGNQSPAQGISAVFPDLHYISINRRDTVAQAVSHWRAIQTQVWNETGEPHVPAGDPVFDFEAIDHLVREVDEHNAAWEGFFVRNNIEPFHVVYEDFVADPASYLRDILRFLDIPFQDPLPLAKPRLRKQADALSQEWTERYREMAPIGEPRPSLVG